MFSRSVSGYDPIIVKSETAARRQKYQVLEDAQNNAIEQGLQHKEELENQLNFVKYRLESARGSKSLVRKYQQYFGSSLCGGMHGRVEHKIQAIIKEAGLFEEEIKDQLASLDKEIMGIKREIRSVVKIVEDILDLNLFGESTTDHLIRELEDFIGHYSGAAEITSSPVSSISLEDDVLLLPTILLDAPDEFLKKELAQVALTGHEAPPVVQIPPQVFDPQPPEPAAKPSEPATKPPEPATNPTVSIVKPAPISSLFGSAPTVLLAENDEPTAQLLRNLLEQEGFQVKYAAEGYQAVKLIHVGPAPDLVIINMLLPYIDGLQLISQIRRKSGWHDIPIIGLTVSYNEQETIEILASGASACMKKPLNHKDLLHKISRLANSSANPQLKS
ncbi:MAG: response regulator [Thermincola sp.]|jgi:CheY-like chemotaxis protein|nr:response regulator [Thermincola sp.]MDT3704110.1 response regulator [Thermincola sp.]